MVSQPLPSCSRLDGVPVDRKTEPIKRATVDALVLATDKLGPLPGGRLASFRAPGQPPNIIEPVHPTDADLTKMAGLAGKPLESLRR